MAVLAYAFPTKEENKLKSYVYPYVYPYFHQSWSMFVPVPKQNFNIYVKYDGSEWHDMFSEIVLAHQRNRLGGYENLALSFSSAVRYYASSVKNENNAEIYKGGNTNYDVLEKMIVQYLKLKNGSAPENLEIIIRTGDSYGDRYHSHYYPVGKPSA
ncbi:MAG TPA: DUF5819 family protein [Bacteroidia bacterium]|nr:DUF5819 family protein [Bacteroidia bacterium]